MENWRENGFDCDLDDPHVWDKIGTGAPQLVQPALDVCVQETY